MMDCYRYANSIDSLIHSLSHSNSIHATERVLAMIDYAKSHQTLERDAHEEYRRVYGRRANEGSEEFRQMLEFIVVEHYSQKLELFESFDRPSDDTPDGSITRTLGGPRVFSDHSVTSGSSSGSDSSGGDADVSSMASTTASVGIGSQAQAMSNNSRASRASSLYLAVKSPTVITRSSLTNRGYRKCAGPRMDTHDTHPSKNTNTSPNTTLFVSSSPYIDTSLYVSAEPRTVEVYKSSGKSFQIKWSLRKRSSRIASTGLPEEIPLLMKTSPPQPPHVSAPPLLYHKMTPLTDTTIDTSPRTNPGTSTSITHGRKKRYTTAISCNRSFMSPTKASLAKASH